jgi:superfamily II DNA or RNA helicase
MSSGLLLRDYQIEALYAMIEAAKRVRARGGEGPAERFLVIQPTGAGKTVEMLSYARGVRKHWGWRTLIIVPYRKLLYQTVEKIRDKLPELTYGLVGDGHFDLSGDVVIAIQASLSPEKLQLIAGDSFQAVICDEAHHAAADNYGEILQHFSRAKVIIGMTATYIRGDEISIASDKYFPNVIVWQTVGQLTHAGWLVEAFGYYKHTGISLDHVRLRGGEFAERQLSRAVNTPERNLKAVEAYREFMDGRPVAAFCVDVAHARSMAECFNEARIPAAAVWGDMRESDFERVMEDYEAGRILVLPNAKLLTEGWDAPLTSGVLIAAPVTKRAAYVKVPQMIGRMLRPDTASGKVDGVAVEMRDNPRKKRGSDETVAVSGLAAMARTTESEFICGRVPLHQQAGRSGALHAWRERRKLLEELCSEEAVIERFDVIERLSQVSVYAWVPLASTLYMPLEDDDFIEVVEENPMCFEVRLCVAGELEVAGTSSSREGALHIADGWVSQHVRNKSLILRGATWRTKAASGKQIGYAHALTKLPTELLNGMTSGQISDLIRSARALLVEPELSGGVDMDISAAGAARNFTPHAWQLRA